MLRTDTTLSLFDAEPAPEVAATSREAVLALLPAWADAGWLRRLDAALPAFLAELDAAASPELLLAAALLSQMEGRGHTCLPLQDLCGDPNALLGWPLAGAQALAELWLAMPAAPAGWQQALQGSAVLRSVDAGEADAGQPLVLAAGRLYLRRYWDHERRVAAQVLDRARRAQPIDEAAAREWLDALFDAPKPGTVDWQRLACAIALRGGFSVITGGPGTGKTYTAARLLALLFAVDPAPERLRIALAAPTGKAAARLKQSLDSALQGLAERLAPKLDLTLLAGRIGAARTLHALLGARPDSRQFRHHAGQPLDVDVLIVDEASMVHLEMMASLLDALPPQARLILLGDKDQLASVEAGAVLADLCEGAEQGGYSEQTARYAQAVASISLPEEYLAQASPPALLAQHTVMLRESRRFGGPIGQLALAVHVGDGARAQQLLRDEGPQGRAAPNPPRVGVKETWDAPAFPCEHGPLWGLETATQADVLRLALHGRPGAPASYQAYLSRLALRPASGDVDAHGAWARDVLLQFERFRLLCAVREGPWGAAGLNRAVQQALAEAGWLQVRGEWFIGRPVMVTRNDSALGVFNGDIGIVLPAAGDGGNLRAWFLDGPRLRSVAVTRLSQVESAFAMTVHKSQGSEFEHTALVLPEQAGLLLSRELVYTGITRAREAFSLLAPRPGLMTQAASLPTRRASGLLDRLRTT
ncbi:exodeoxyribonuclease V subunit alpha [Ideonella azotifigens]|uniref:RecBCD enzyme subunit RecD n=2 Tax=Ideonella azotifigens TaxID=513160 RepID=A0ABN1JSN0_9BURK|nr:exodeoxyribonuclease V subunit alpha [Ideonella azotifigens]MCD2340939.1 exodeoxyribonuclease V subunit alpha [Ideonella azotifigens]